MVTLAFVHTLLDRVSDHYRDQIGDNPKTLINKGVERLVRYLVSNE